MEPNRTRPVFRVAAIVIALWGLYVARSFFVPVLLAALLAFLMAPLMRLLKRWHFADWAAITLSGFLMVLPLGLFSVTMVVQLQNLTNDFPSYVASFEHTLDGVSHSELSKKLNLTHELTVPALTSRLSKSAGQGIQVALEGARAALEAGAKALLIFVFSILMLVYRRHLADSAVKLLEIIEGVQGERMLEEITSLVERFFIARLLIVVIVGVAATGILVVAKIPYAVLIAVVVGLMTLIPGVGAVVGLALAMTVALAAQHTALSLTFLFAALLLLHVIESNVLTPKLVGGKLNLNALVTFLGMFAGGLLWGVWGMLLSVPLLAVLRIALSVSSEFHPWAELLSETRTEIPRSFLVLGPFFRNPAFKRRIVETNA